MLDSAELTDAMDAKLEEILLAPEDDVVEPWEETDVLETALALETELVLK